MRVRKRVATAVVNQEPVGVVLLGRPSGPRQHMLRVEYRAKYEKEHIQGTVEDPK